MLINEDYFKDLEISEEDIQDITSISDDNDTNINGINIFNKCNYDYTICIQFANEHYLDELTKKVALKKVALLFDSYGIDHSEIYVISGFGYLNGKSFDNTPVDIEKTEIGYENDYISLTNYSNSKNNEEIRNKPAFKEHSMLMFFKKPKFSNIKHLLSLMQRLLNISYYNNKKAFAVIDIYNFVIDMYNQNEKLNIDENHIKLVVRTNGIEPYLTALIQQKKVHYNNVSVMYLVDKMEDLITFFFGNEKWEEFNSQFISNGNVNKIEDIDFSI